MSKFTTSNTFIALSSPTEQNNAPSELTAILSITPIEINEIKSSNTNEINVHDSKKKKNFKRNFNQYSNSLPPLQKMNKVKFLPR